MGTAVLRYRENRQDDCHKPSLEILFGIILGRQYAQKKSGYPALLRKRQGQEPRSFVILWHEFFCVFKVCFMLFITPTNSIYHTDCSWHRGQVEFTGVRNANVLITSSCPGITRVAVILLADSWTHMSVLVVFQVPRGVALWLCSHHAASWTADSLRRKMLLRNPGKNKTAQGEIAMSVYFWLRLGFRRI